jgi:DNA-binding MarR family transcriptional regulator
MPTPGRPDLASPATDRLVYVVNRLARAMNRATDDVASSHGISLPELMALLVLGEDVALSNAQLARRTFVTSQSAHAVVTDLARRGLVQRGSHDTNRRLKVARLTDAGWQVLTSCRSEIEATEGKLLAQLVKRDRDALLPTMLHAAQIIKGGWFGNDEAEQTAADRRAGRG